MSLFSPYVLLALVIAFATSNLYSYHRGGANKLNAIKANQLDTVRKRVKVAIEKANETRAADVKGETKTAAAIQAKDLLAMEARHALDLDIERTRRERAENTTCPVTTCDLDAKSHGLLIDAIRRANNGTADKAPAGGKPDAPLPRDPAAPRRGRGDGEKVVLRLDPALRRMP